MRGCGDGLFGPGPGRHHASRGKLRCMKARRSALALNAGDDYAGNRADRCQFHPNFCTQYLRLTQAKIQAP